MSAPSSSDVPVKPGQCPRCLRWNLLDATKCVYCQAPMVPAIVVRPGLPGFAKPLIAVVLLVAGGATGARIYSGQQQPIELASAPAPPIATAAPTPAPTSRPPVKAAPVPIKRIAKTTGRKTRRQRETPHWKAPVIAPSVEEETPRRAPVVKVSTPSNDPVGRREVENELPPARSTVSAASGGFAQQVAGLIAEIEGMDSDADELRMRRKLIGLREQYKAIHQAIPARKGGVMNLLIGALDERRNPNPAIPDLWHQRLDYAQNAANAVDRAEAMTPAQKERASNDFMQKMLNTERQAAQGARR